MAKRLNETGIQSGQIVRANHVSQSIDAFTGQDAYNINISGSLEVTGSLLVSGSNVDLSNSTSLTGSIISASSIIGTFTGDGSGLTNVSNIDEIALIYSGSNNAAIVPQSGSNTSDGAFSTVGGGTSNVNNSERSTIAGGDSNTIASTTTHNSIGGGQDNSIVLAGSHNTIGGGNLNIISGSNSGILGGYNNVIEHDNSFIIGSNLTSSADNTTYMDNVYVSGSLEIDNLTLLDDLNVPGNITASGNISASGDIFGVTGSFSHLEGNSPITVGDSITFQQPITASSDISSSGNIFGSQLYAQGGQVFTSNTSSLRNVSNGLSVGSGPQFQSVTLGRSGADMNLLGTLASSLTASNSVAISGANAINADRLTADTRVSTPEIQGSSGVLTIDSTNVNLVGSLTASGHISGSLTSTGSFGRIESTTINTTTINTTTIDASGDITGEDLIITNITASNVSASSGIFDGNQYRSNGIGVLSHTSNTTNIGKTGTATNIYGIVNSITASGDISGSATTTGSLGSIILTSADGLAFQFTVNNEGHLSLTGSAI